MNTGPDIPICTYTLLTYGVLYRRTQITIQAHPQVNNKISDHHSGYFSTLSRLKHNIKQYQDSHTMPHFPIWPLASPSVANSPGCPADCRCPDFLQTVRLSHSATSKHHGDWSSISSRFLQNVKHCQESYRMLGFPVRLHHFRTMKTESTSY